MLKRKEAAADNSDKSGSEDMEIRQMDSNSDNPATSDEETLTQIKLGSVDRSKVVVDSYFLIEFANCRRKRTSYIYYVAKVLSLENYISV